MKPLQEQGAASTSYRRLLCPHHRDALLPPVHGIARPNIIDQESVINTYVRRRWTARTPARLLNAVLHFINNISQRMDAAARGPETEEALFSSWVSGGT